jgi:DNA-binding transcriptional LysR family regulator
MPLDELIFREFDLNSLLTFMMVYQTRGVTRAAQALDVTQPAVSNVLGKLRVQFKDPLFIPQGRTVRPTAKALAIAQALEPAMAAIQGIIASRSKTGSRG